MPVASSHNDKKGCRGDRLRIAEAGREICYD